MTLVLRGLSLNEEPLSNPLVGRFDDRGGEIGRSDNATFTLPDPERLISRVHARISHASDAYWIENVSAAGPILHNGRPLSSGMRVSLKAGDELRIGGYRLTVAFEDDETSATILRGRTAGQTPGRVSPAVAPRVNAAPPPRAAEPGPPRAAEPGPTRAAGPGPTRAAGPGPTRAVEPAPTRAVEPAPTRAVEPAPTRAVEPAPTRAVEPAPTRAVEPAPTRAVEPGPTRAAAPAAERGVVGAPAASPPVERAAPAPSAATAVAARAPAAANRGTRATRVRPASESAVDGDAMWRGFQDGVGVDLPLPNGPSPELFSAIGAMLRIAVNGLHRLITMRAVAKSEMHADLTMIQVRGNNPLKFAPEAAAALKMLLQPPVQGFMSGPAALRDAVIDLQSHQVGVMAGMRAALAAVLERFDPVQLETQLSSRSFIDALMPSHRRAKLWELYVEHARTLRDEAQDDFGRLFGEAFLEAYNAQIQSLEAAGDEAVGGAAQRPVGPKGG
jgi:FHA domain-containing protein